MARDAANDRHASHSSDGLSEEILFSSTQTFYASSRNDKKKRSQSTDSSSPDDIKATKRKKTKGRTPSHVAKREEKTVLLKELAFLDARAAQLRKEAGLPDPKEVAATEEQLMINRQLKEMVEVQQNAMAAAHSAFSEFTTLRGHNPLKSYIHLSNDAAERRAEIGALKERHLQRAHSFLKQRMELMTDPCRPCHEESGYITDEGHYITTMLDVHQFTGVQSVKQMFDAMLFYFMNLEITTTEMGENLTVREDSNDLDVDFSQNPTVHHRLVTMLPCGPVVEKNAIKFFQYVDEDDEGDGPYGIMAASPVDEDELYPYSPAERFWKDISAAMKVSALRCKTKHLQPEGDTEHEELVVVLVRWFRVQLYHSDLKYPQHVLHEVRRNVMPFTDSMIRSINQSLYGAA